MIKQKLYGCYEHSKKMFSVIEFSPVQAKKKKLLLQYHNFDFDSQRISAQY